jgi:hypothetical protein
MRDLFGGLTLSPASHTLVIEIYSADNGAGEGDDDTSCKTILSSVAVDRKYNNVYTVRYHCWGYRGLSRQKTTHSWIETKRIWLGKGDTVLVIDQTK